ncbi:LysR substrate-binding domain-containing protein [Vibrio makurazakiensis]|uniref:LysR substrate-binding domain-containing protein n=1 Tax=Vibrio makurazakiensis TaxID=2910250 RepID=UPI003D0D22F0
MKHLKSNMASALMTFVEVGHCGSLTKAAKSKSLTTGAISQQLLQLESNLGLQLLQRHSRGVTLTESGMLLHRVAVSSFEDIDNVLDSLKAQSQHSSEVRLKLTPSFAFKWLVPRLEGFHRLHPEIQIQTFAEGALVDHASNDYDLAIDYGELPYRDSNATLLLEESLLPVMSPTYLEQHDWLLERGAGNEPWSRVTLLHDAQPWDGAARDHEWAFWAKSHGLKFETEQGHFFNRTDMAMSAAEAGVGIALARQALIQDELESGRLVAPFSPIKANAGYFLLSHSSSKGSHFFSDWMMKQVIHPHS